jgi:hypothetical protein
MKKIFLVLAAGITIMSCKEADKKVDADTSGSTTAAPTTNESANIANASNTNTNVQQNGTTIDPATLTTVEWLDGIKKDFGKIKEGEILNVTFRFKNTGTKPLVISNVTAGCGCTIPETPKKPYAPGETGEIKATFNSSGKVGSNSKPVYVTANANPQMTTLTFNVEVTPKKG